jgi:hypothetical protein
MSHFLAQTATGGTLLPQLWAGLRTDWAALAWLGLVQLATLLAFWLAARVLVPRRELNSFGQYERRQGAGFGKAFALYFCYLVLAVAAFFLLRLTSTSFKLALITLFSSPTQLEAKWIAIFALLAPLSLLIKLGLPMAIFRIRLPRAVGYLLFSALLIVAAGWALDLALRRPVEKRVLTLREWAARQSGHGGLLKSLAAQAEEEVVFAATERVAADATKPMRERKDAVRSLYTQLEEIRGSLPPGDTAALAEYDKKKLRYETLLKQLRAEIAAHPEATE